MAYSWIFAPLNDSYLNISKNLIVFFIESVFPKMIELMITPFIHPEILWIISPLIIATIFMILYFGRYKNEQLGWNTAFGNNIALLFVGINLLQMLWQKGMLISPKAAFIYAMVFYNIVQLILNYFHITPKKISFALNSAFPVNFMNYFAIMVVYSDLPLDLAAIMAGAIFFLILYFIQKTIWMIVPMSKGSKIFSSLQQKKMQKLREREERMIKRDEALKMESDNLSKAGIIIYLALYISLMIIDRLFFALGDYYLLILSAYFLIFSIIYIKIKKLNLANLLISDMPIKRDAGVFIGILIFFYYLITSNFFASLFGAKEYSPNAFFLILSIIMASFACEIFFRGVIQRSLKIKNSKNKSVAIQALLWSILGMDFFKISISSIHFALFGALMIYPIGLLLGYIKEQWHLDCAISASLTAGLISIIAILA